MTGPEIRQEIERTSEQLGQTVAELAAKADVTARARGKAAEVSERVRTTVSGLQRRARRSQLVRRQLVRRRWPLAAAAALVAVGWVVTSAARRRTR